MLVHPQTLCSQILKEGTFSPLLRSSGITAAKDIKFISFRDDASNSILLASRVGKLANVLCSRELIEDEPQRRSAHRRQRRIVARERLLCDVFKQSRRGGPHGGAPA